MARRPRVHARRRALARVRVSRIGAGRAATQRARRALGSGVSGSLLGFSRARGSPRRRDPSQRPPRAPRSARHATIRPALGNARSRLRSGARAHGAARGSGRNDRRRLRSDQHGPGRVRGRSRDDRPGSPARDRGRTRNRGGRRAADRRSRRPRACEAHRDGARTGIVRTERTSGFTPVNKEEEKLMRKGILALWLFTGMAGAVEAPIVPAASNGSFTVTYQRCSGCFMDWLEERVGDTGAWNAIGSGNKTYTSKTYGRYYYRVAYMYMAPDYSYYMDYSSPASVVVASAVPPVNPLEVQLTYRYEARRGDINGDGRTDLFVARASGGAAGDGTVDQVILRQAANGTFTASAPSGAEAQTARNWALATVRILLQG